MILPTHKKNEVSDISIQKGIDVLKQKYQDLILDSPIYIESFDIEYIPIPIQDKDLYGGNFYRPFLIFKVKEKDQTDKVIIDPVGWKEVS